MIKPDYRIAALLILLALAGYLKDQAQAPWILSSIGWQDLAARLVDEINVIRHFSPRVTSPAETINRRNSQGAEFKCSKELQDWVLSRAASEEQSESSGEPRGSIDSCIWPEDSNCPGDRIISQIKLKPQRNEQDRVLKIAIADDSDQTLGSQPFDTCNYNKCQVTRNLYEADAIIFRDADVSAIKKWPLLEESKYRQRQIWIAYLLESPPNTFDPRYARLNRDGRRHFNWTATYRGDSDIVTPYAKFLAYEDSLKEFLALKNLAGQSHQQLPHNGTELHQKRINKKQGKVAWFVSNCYARNNRLEYARELSKYIQVDIYGKCGNFTCSKWSQKECLDRINGQYKFYLSFENSNNRNYISEKLYRNALGYNDPEHALLPIVMGPPKSDYARLAPPHSFIHVDDFQSPEGLASFLNNLNSDDAAFSAYFKWKSLGRFIDTKFPCRVCALLHRSRSQVRVKIYDNLRDWWLND